MEQGKYSLSLCMIAKNEEENLPALWQSVKHIVDEWIVVDTGSTDSTVKVAKQLGAKVIEKPHEFITKLTQAHVDFFAKYGVKAEVGEEIFEFGKARTFSFEQATKEFILWLDADDILIGSDRLTRIMNSNLDPKQQLGLHLLYKYELDQYQNPIIQHYRERVVPNNKTFKWQGRIHEIIVPTLETQYIRVLPEDCHVLHNVGSERKVKSGERNTKSLLLDLYEQGDSPDPRTLFFLAESMKIAGKLDTATGLYEKYIKLSGWDEERCLAAMRLCGAHLVKGDFHKALEWAYRAIKERPDFPVGYSSACQCYYGMGDYENAIRFAQRAIETPQPETVVMVDEKYNMFIPLYVAAEAFLRKGMYKEALSFVKDALRYEPINSQLQRIQYTCERMLQEHKLVKAIGALAKFLKGEGELEKARNLMDNIPSCLGDEPVLQTVRDDIKGEIMNRQGLWVSKEKRLKEGTAVDPQYALFFNDLKKFKCKSVLLVSNEPLLAIGLKNSGIDVKRVIKFEDISKKYDAVFFDYHLHLLEDRKEWIEQGLQFATKLIGLCVPNRDPNGLIQCTPDVVEEWFGAYRTWNVIPLKNGVIYAAALLDMQTKPKVTFFCGGESVEAWGPLSHLEQGCGGSEEATIYLSRELAAQNHKVEVINSYPHPCTVDGVKWRHVSSLKPNEEFENLVLWRLPHYLDQYQLKPGKKTFLWLHDVPQDYWFKPERLEKIDKIICLSKYHRSLLPQLPDEKFIISQNGVEINQFNLRIERNAKKVIYTSSYDRGLEHLLKIWPEVKKEVPEAELHVYYGWGTFDKLRTEEKHRRWKSWMMEQFKQEGVYEHGRVDQVTLAKEFISSGVFAYPCHFEEISCISAMKAQVGGCIPLTTDYAALAETNLTGFKVHGNPRESEAVMKEFKEKLIRALTLDVDRQEIMSNARNSFSWSNVAFNWSSQFLGGHYARS